jgi:ubiquinone/menaquinone biosynthesis C-methylase UbiE
MYPDVNVICADLQDIPKSKGYFDLILDFSTIDHITNYKKVLDEYKRVLNLITWTSPFGYGKGLNLARQCFNRKEFEEELNKRFYVVYNNVLFRRNIRKYIALREYKCFQKVNFNPNELVIMNKLGIHNDGTEKDE